MSWCDTVKVAVILAFKMLSGQYLGKNKLQEVDTVQGY